MDILEYLKVLYHRSTNLPYIIQILKRTNLARLHPVLYLSSAFYTQSKPTPALFSDNYIYSPSCLPQTQKVVVSTQLHWLLVCFGHLYNEIHIVRNRKFTQALP